MNLKALRAVLFFLSAVSPLAARAQTDVSLWLTNPDRSALFERQTPPLPLASATTTNQVINVDGTKTYQTMDGFGFALTGGSAQLISGWSRRNGRLCCRSCLAWMATTLG